MPRKKALTGLFGLEIDKASEVLIKRIVELSDENKLLLEENRRLRMAILLRLPKKRPRGRPKKAHIEKPLPKKRGRKPNIYSLEWLKEIDAMKKNFGVKTDRDVLQKWFEQHTQKKGLRKSRVNDPRTQAAIKTFLNKISKLRNPRN